MDYAQYQQIIKTPENAVGEKNKNRKLYTFIVAVLIILIAVGLMLLARLSTKRGPSEVSRPPIPSPTISPEILPEDFIQNLFSKITDNNKATVSALISPRATFTADAFADLYGKQLTYKIVNKFVETPGTIAHFTLSINVDGKISLRRVTLVKETNDWLLANHEVVQPVKISQP